MTRQLWIADRLRAYGLNVVEIEGWRTRGSATFDPKVLIAHHTAGSQGSATPSLNICIHGRSDLPGPLCQVYIGRDLKAYVVASGRANHAGSGGWRGVSGNTYSMGIEAENDGRTEPWTPAFLDVYYRVCRALLDGMRRDASWLCGHKEWAPSRKIDPHSLNMNAFRADVARTTPAEEDMPLNKEDLDAISYRVIKVLRQAVGPDDAKTPAGDYFRRVERRLKDLQGKVADLEAAGATGGLSDADVARVAQAVMDELSKRSAA